VQQEADRARGFSRRAVFLGAAQLAFFGALGARLYHLQVRRSAEYTLLAEDNRANQRLLVPPRGRILDRLGRPLARNVPTYRVLLVREQASDTRRVLDRLAGLVTLTPAEIEEIQADARRQRPFVPITVREGLSWDEVARIAIRSPELPGVVLDSALLRDYPQGEALAHVLGYVGAVSPTEQEIDPDPLLQLPDFRIGKSGIERSYDKALRGRAGLSRVEVNAIGREIRELDRKEGEGGADVRLALDLDLQRFCAARLSSELSASTVVVDVRSGAVLALASVPSFAPSAFTGGLRRSVWTELRDSPRTPLVNKCIRGQYPPGSTFKMITALAGLEAGISPTVQVRCQGSVSLGAARFHCWKEHGHGRLGLVQALEQSCDVYFYELARRVGIDAIAAMAARFGLGQPTGIDLPGEQPGLIPTRAWKKATFDEGWHQGETLVCGIGQGYVLATPLQLAIMTARLANGGLAVTPWCARIDGEQQPPAPGPIGVAKASLDYVLRGMRDVVHGPRGTARAAALGVPGVEIGGKTGTSQVRRISKADRDAGRHKRKDIPWEQRDHALFVCFGPFEAPRYAVSVIVEHGMSGARAAAPIARDILRKTLEIDPAPAAPASVAALGGDPA
jgi:penicillin-binding protein 2